MALHDDAEKASPRSSGETANEAGWDETAQLFHPDRNPEPKYFVFHAAPQSQRLLLLCRHTVARVRARVADKRRPLTLAAALVGLVLLIVTLAHVGLFRVRGHRGGPGGGSSSSVAELLKTISHDTFGGSTEYCTTWPVAEDGAYNATRSAPRPNDLDTLAPSGGWAKPDGFKVVGLIFYGRRRNVDTLDCYLMQNLAVNGGYLDEVHFIVHTDEDHDIAFLNQLVAARDHYQIEEVGPCEGHDFSCMWDTSTKTDTLYIKIDDDIVRSPPSSLRPFPSGARHGRQAGQDKTDANTA